MPINPLIPLQTESLNAVGTLGAAQQFNTGQKRNELLDLEVRNQRGVNESSEEERMLRSVVFGAENLRRFVESNDLEGGQRFLEARLKSLRDAGRDTQETEAALRGVMRAKETGDVSDLISGLDQIRDLGERVGLFQGQFKPVSDPAAVREFQFFKNLTPDEQAQFLEVKRAVPIEDINRVPTRVGMGGQTQPLSTLESEAAAAGTIAGAEAGARAEAGQGGLSLTPGQLAVDKAFADDFTQWQAAGGFADVQKNLSQLRDVRDKLERGEGNLTGFAVGNQPRAVLATTNPEALDALEQVEEVVQRNLRLILGAQFTEREGLRLIARAYNPRLDEKTNATRVGRLLTSLEAAAKAKQDAADYFSRNGTLSGFQGTTPTLTTIEGAIEEGSSDSEQAARLEALRREVEELENAR